MRVTAFLSLAFGVAMLWTWFHGTKLYRYAAQEVAYDQVAACTGNRLPRECK